MSLPISMWGVVIALMGVIAISSGVWLLLRARDVARTARSVSDAAADAIQPGGKQRPGTSRFRVRIILLVNIVSTVAALTLFALVATRTIGSPETITNPHAQRP
jgi:hypothetical protein